jgi:acetamidase/formamidase
VAVHCQHLLQHNKMPALAPPRNVQLNGGPTTQWVLEMRALHVNKAAYKNIHRTLESLIRRRMAVNEYTLTSLATDMRHEIVVLAVVERKTAVSRADNVFLSWMRIVTKLLQLEGSQRRRA